MLNIKRFKELDSTNDYLKNEHVNLPHETFVISDTQHSGRGRGDHKWTSPLGNLYCSYILKNNLQNSTLFHQVCMVSVAVINVLNHYGLKAVIKYPNDILVNQKKIAGILVESRGNTILDFIIVGIGINVNQLDFFDLNEKAISIKQLVNYDISVEEVFDLLIHEYRILSLQTHFSIYLDYLEHSYVIGKEILYQQSIWKIYNITEDGFLELRCKEQIRKVQLNEISLAELY